MWNLSLSGGFSTLKTPCLSLLTSQCNDGQVCKKIINDLLNFEGIAFSNSQYIRFQYSFMKYTHTLRYGVPLGPSCRCHNAMGRRQECEDVNVQKCEGAKTRKRRQECENAMAKEHRV